ncbi:FliH/SctL family protein [Sphingomonas sp. RS6]
MSDFTPGLVARHPAGQATLQPPPAGMADFAPAPIARERRRRTGDAPAAPRHFSPARPGTNPTEGWDPFDPAPVAPPPSATPAPMDMAEAIAAAHAAGRAEALAEVALRDASHAALAERLAATLGTGAHIDRERIAAALRQTVLQLVARLIDDSGIDGALLAARINAATELLAEASESTLLRMHPDDVALVEGRLPANLFAVGDPNVARGAFVLESASTLVEDGPALWLAHLADALDRVTLPPAC